MSVTIPPPRPLAGAHDAPAAAGPATPPRLALVPPGRDRHRLDGAWWPHSRDLTRELPALIAALDARFGRIGRVTVNASMWPTVPNRVPVPGHVIRVGWFSSAEQDPHDLCFLGASEGRWDLLVVPPECDAEAAARLMDAAATPSNALTSGALLAALAVPAERPERESAWESEGGSAPEPGRPAAAAVQGG